MSKHRSTSKDLADWTRLLSERRSPDVYTAPSQTVRARLGAWNVNLIGVVEDGGFGVEVNCPADLLLLHAELVNLFGLVQEEFGRLVEQATTKNDTKEN
jgi:hypothetical protein